MNKVYILALVTVAMLAACNEQAQQGEFLSRKSGANQFVDGSMENHAAGVMADPFISRPDSSPNNFKIEKGAAADGKQLLRYQAQGGGEWWGISQKIQLKPGKKYTTSFYIKGDSAEVHCGAFNSGRFLGWNNATVPTKEWQLVSYDFYCDTASAKTTIYIAAQHPNKDFEIMLDDIQVVQELPNKK